MKVTGGPCTSGGPGKLRADYLCDVSIDVRDREDESRQEKVVTDGWAATLPALIFPQPSSVGCPGGLVFVSQLLGGLCPCCLFLSVSLFLSRSLAHAGVCSC